MNEGSVKQVAARIRNLFAVGDLQKRYDDGRVQVKTGFGRVVEKREAFPYGFTAKAKAGKVFVVCQGGNFDGFEIFPVAAYEGGPKLNDNDAALYTASGGWIAAREDGTVELFGKNYGGVIKVRELQNQLAKLTARVDGIVNALKNAVTAAQDGGAAYKAGIVTALTALTNKEDFSGIASDKVFHGDGESDD
jgi:hypothetical protein